jgi:hypothetical protein
MLWPGVQDITGTHELHPGDKGVVPIALHLSRDCLHLMCVLPVDDNEKGSDCVNEVKGVPQQHVFDICGTRVRICFLYLMYVALSSVRKGLFAHAVSCLPTVYKNAGNDSWRCIKTFRSADRITKGMLCIWPTQAGMNSCDQPMRRGTDYPNTGRYVRRRGRAGRYVLPCRH